MGWKRPLGDRAIRLCSFEAFEILEALKAKGFAIAIVSGDREVTTRHLAKTLKIDRVFSECSPAEKVRLLRETHKTSGPGVAMVVMASMMHLFSRSGRWCCPWSGTDLAKQSSDVTLLGDDLSRILWLLDLSKLLTILSSRISGGPLGIIRLRLPCFLWSRPPTHRRDCMLLSSVSVIVNSMRILHKV